LETIGKALHAYLDQYGRYPPAFVSGPDGKPWHSWRVLLLPYLNEAALYEQYKFNEPWDGPHNRQLLEKMPEVYRDPIYGARADFYAHYAAATGRDAVFPSTGLRFDGKAENLRDALKRRDGARQVREVTRGLANVLFVGSVSPGRKIPWSKPEDVVCDDKLPLFRPDGFAAPYEMGNVRAGVMLMGDAKVYPFRADLGPAFLQRIFKIAEIEGAAEQPAGGFQESPLFVRTLEIPLASTELPARWGTELKSP
jgi:hypothetical protein